MPMTAALDRGIPRNLDAERALLGMILVDSSTLNVALETVGQDDFFSFAHTEIFKKMLDLMDTERPIDLVHIAELLELDGNLVKVGGAAYLASLGDGVPVAAPAMVKEYAVLVREKSNLRKIINACHNVQSRAAEQVTASDELAAFAVEQFLDFDVQKLSDAPLRTYHQAAYDLMRKLETRKELRVTTGIPKVDEVTGGFLGGELIVVTAETGVGKTILASQIRGETCRKGMRALFASAEMTGEHLVSREMAVAGHVPAWKLRAPEKLDPDEWEALRQAAGHQCRHCRILDGEVSIARIKAAARRMKAEGGLDLVLIDYDELVDAPGKGEMEQQAAVATGAKRLSKSLDVPVVMISQLRKLLNGEDRRKPSIGRLYGSGAKVKHASIIIYVNREYVQTMTGSEVAAEIWILKNRDGKVGRTPAHFNVRLMKFCAVAEGEEAS